MLTLHGVSPGGRDGRRGCASGCLGSGADWRMGFLRRIFARLSGGRWRWDGRRRSGVPGWARQFPRVLTPGPSPARRPAAGCCVGFPPADCPRCGYQGASVSVDKEIIPITIERGNVDPSRATGAGFPRPCVPKELTVPVGWLRGMSVRAARTPLPQAGEVYDHEAHVWLRPTAALRLPPGPCRSRPDQLGRPLTDCPLTVGALGYRPAAMMTADALNAPACYKRLPPYGVAKS
jgi:hypothetical protein